MATVAVLCARVRSVYFDLAGVEVYDRTRDARSFRGGVPVVAHPPCGQWGRLKGQARRCEAERELGRFCVEAVRRNGGVLEHPANSTLWGACGLPVPGCGDVGGWTLSVDQLWWGHRARKRTWLFVAGVEPRDVPPLPLALEGPEIRRIESMGRREREATPLAFARWLVDLAARAGQAELWMQ